MRTKPFCYDCKREYGKPGFPDLVIPNYAWERISPYGRGGLLCPSCICSRLSKAKIRCYGAFMSGPIKSVGQLEMEMLRSIENLKEKQ